MWPNSISGDFCTLQGTFNNELNLTFLVVTIQGQCFRSLVGEVKDATKYPVKQRVATTKSYLTQTINYAETVRKEAILDLYFPEQAIYFCIAGLLHTVFPMPGIPFFYCLPGKHTYLSSPAKISYLRQNFP